MTTMSFSKSAQWKTGLRTYFEYRDLGIVGATGGKVLAHVIRATAPCSGPGGADAGWGGGPGDPREAAMLRAMEMRMAARQGREGGAGSKEGWGFTLARRAGDVDRCLLYVSFASASLSRR